MSAESPRLLIVEDVEILAEITGFRLELLGYQVTCVTTGERAWAAIQSRPPHLVILDTTLPDMDGLELVNRLRSDPQVSHIPLLLFSADGDLDIVQRAYLAGANEILVTPYDPVVLEQKVESLLEQAKCATSA